MDGSLSRLFSVLAGAPLDMSLDFEHAEIERAPHTGLLRRAKATRGGINLVRLRVGDVHLFPLPANGRGLQGLRNQWDAS